MQRFNRVFRTSDVEFARHISAVCTRARVVRLSAQMEYLWKFAAVVSGVGRPAITEHQHIIFNKVGFGFGHFLQILKSDMIFADKIP